MGCFCVKYNQVLETFEFKCKMHNRHFVAALFCFVCVFLVENVNDLSKVRNQWLYMGPRPNFSTLPLQRGSQSPAQPVNAAQPSPAPPLPAQSGDLAAPADVLAVCRDLKAVVAREGDAAVPALVRHLLAAGRFVPGASCTPHCLRRCMGAGCSVRTKVLLARDPAHRTLKVYFGSSVKEQRT